MVAVFSPTATGEIRWSAIAGFQGCGSCAGRGDRPADGTGPDFASSIEVWDNVTAARLMSAAGAWLPVAAPRSLPGGYMIGYVRKHKTEADSPALRRASLFQLTRG